MLSPNSNFNATTGARLFNEMSLFMNRAMERLATGKRINRAADDVAGLIAATAMGLDQSRLQANIQAQERELARLGALDGASGVVGDLVSDLQGLLTTAANTGGQSKEERGALSDHANSIVQAIDKLSTITTFDGQDILASFATGKLGSSNGFTLSDLRSGGALNLLNGDLDQAQKVLSQALNDVSTARAATGNRVRDLEQGLRVDLSQFENQAGIHSLIEDADIASETSAFMRGQILSQSTLLALNLFLRSDSDSALRLLG